MNTSISTDASQTDYQELISKERIARLPFGILVLVCYVIGITGNSHVVHVFRSVPRKKTPSEAIILTLAIFDIITNVVFIFKEYNRLMFVMFDDNEVICKVTNFTGFVAGLASSFFVLVLAVYRYQRLFKRNTKESTVVVIVVKMIVCVIASAVISIPVVLVIGHQRFHIDRFTMYRCWIDEDQVHEDLPTIVFMFLLILASIVCGIVTFCNIRIINALKKSRSNLAKLSDRKKRMSMKELETKLDTVVIDRSEFDSQVTITDKPTSSGAHPNGPTTTTNSPGDTSTPNAPHKEDPNNGMTSPAVTPNDENQASENRDDDLAPTPDGSGRDEDLIKSIAFTITILIVSFTIMISYILFLSLYFYVIFKRKEPSFAYMSIQEDTFFTYATDIVSLNAVVNPFVYFFSDKKYRSYVMALYKRKEKRYEGLFRLTSF